MTKDSSNREISRSPPAHRVSSLSEGPQAADLSVLPVTGLIKHPGLGLEITGFGLRRD